MLILPVTIMDKNIKGLILLALVLLWRKFLNIKAVNRLAVCFGACLYSTCFVLMRFLLRETLPN